MAIFVKVLRLQRTDPTRDFSLRSVRRAENGQAEGGMSPSEARARRYRHARGETNGDGRSATESTDSATAVLLLCRQDSDVQV